MVNFGQVTAEIERVIMVIGVHPFVDQRFGYVHLVAPLLDLTGSGLSFVEWSDQNSVLGALLLCRAGYTLSSVTHFLFVIKCFVSSLPRSLSYRPTQSCQLWTGLTTFNSCFPGLFTAMIQLYPSSF